MASEVDICNRALQKLGAKRITSLSDDSTNARACNASYEIVRDAELRSHPWTFATARASLAADSTEPDWGRENSFTLPSDYINILPPYPEDNMESLDWEVEGGKIYTDDSAPLYIRYTSRVSDTSLFDSLFIEALAASLAFEMCEELTQSNSKKESLRSDYDRIIGRAKKRNAMEKVSATPPLDSWITVRS